MPLSIDQSWECCQEAFGKNEKGAIVVTTLSVVGSSDLSSVQIRQQLLPHLWRNPDQERMGHDRCSLCGQVGDSSITELTELNIYINVFHYFFP